MGASPPRMNIPSPPPPPEPIDKEILRARDRERQRARAAFGRRAMITGAGAAQRSATLGYATLLGAGRRGA